jgi:hypothetical protein
MNRIAGIAILSVLLTSSAAHAAPWQKLPGQARSIASGADGSLWTVGTIAMGNGNYALYRWVGAGWVQANGAGVKVAVDGSGIPWVINAAGEIFVSSGGQWKRVPGSARDIAAGADGSVWVIGALHLAHRLTRAERMKDLQHSSWNRSRQRRCNAPEKGSQYGCGPAKIPTSENHEESRPLDHRPRPDSSGVRLG